MPDKKKTWAERIQDIMGTATAPMKELGENIQQGKPWFDYGPGPLEEAPRAGVQQWVNQHNAKPWAEPTPVSPQFDVQNFAGAGQQPTRLTDTSASAPQAQPWSAPAASPPPRFDVQSLMGNDPFLPPGALMQPAPKETPSAIQTPTPNTVTTPELPTPDKTTKNQPISAQPKEATAGQPQQTGNRYIDMLMAGPEAQREAEQQANIIETIRGTPGTSTGTHDRNAPSNTFGYFNPNNPRAKEYSDKIGAITGMDRDVALGLHGVDAPIQGNLAQEGIRQAGAKAVAGMNLTAAAQAGGKPEFKILDANPVTGDKAKIVKMDGRGNVSVLDIDNAGIDPNEMNLITQYANRYLADPKSINEEEAVRLMPNLTPQGRRILMEMLGITGKK